MNDEKPPKGFTLEAEKSRESQARISGITERTVVLDDDEFDSDIKEEDGVADNNDDEAKEEGLI